MSDEKKIESVGDISKKIENSLSSLLMGISGGDPGSLYSPQISKIDTLSMNNRWYLLSNYRQILSQLYVEHGVVQSLVEQPVDDAFAQGFEITTDMLDAEDKKDLLTYIEQNNVLAAIIQGAKWTRLYGGGGVVIITGQKPDTQLSPLKKGDKLAFRSFDLWEMYYAKMNEQGINDEQLNMNFDKPDFHFDYYGKKVHPSRVLMLRGKEPPSFVRPRLRGWGMSELERMVRSFNSYLKNQDLIFELLDEAKIDVFKIDGFNSALMSNGGTESVQKRVQLANQLKNYMNALTMDQLDDYQQKQMSFSGLGDILTQIRQGVAADLKMPMTKLFGLSSTGFNAGEDDIENYNSMVNSEVRMKIKYHVIEAVRLCAQAKFGIDPEDLNLEWTPLRILTSEQEENVKDRRFNRVVSAYSSGLIDAKDAKTAINKGNLLPVEINESDEIFDNPTGDFTTKDVKEAT